MSNILWKSDVESSRKDQTWLDSTSESKKVSQLEAILDGVRFTCSSKSHARAVVGSFQSIFFCS